MRANAHGFSQRSGDLMFYCLQLRRKKLQQRRNSLHELRTRILEYDSSKTAPTDSVRQARRGEGDRGRRGQHPVVRIMALERYLRTLDAAFRNRDGPSMARCFSATAGDIPFSKDFVPYLYQVLHTTAPVQQYDKSINHGGCLVS